MILAEEPTPSEEMEIPFRIPNQRLRNGSSLWRFIPTLLATLALLALGWAAWILIQHPDTGIVWSYQTGTVLSIDPKSPAFRHFQVGDRIMSIDGVAPYQARGLPGRLSGDIVTFVIERGEQQLQIQLPLGNPSLRVLFNRLSTLLVATSFWLLGVLVMAYSQRDQLTNIFFLFSHTFTIVLGLGSISAFAPLWSGWLFSLMLWWVGPIVLHTHLLLARPMLSGNQVKALVCIYGLAFVFTLVDLVRLASATPGLIQAIKYLWLGLILVFATFILINASRIGKPVEFRRKTRIAGLSALIAFLPFVLFSLIPDALFGYYLFPYEVSFLSLPVLPLGYS